MSKKSKAFVSDSGSDSDEERQSKPAKKAKLEKNTSKNKDEYQFQLADKRFVTVRAFRGKTYVDLREYYEKDGEVMPGKKGISLTIDQYKKLLELREEIDRSIAALA